MGDQERADILGRNIALQRAERMDQLPAVDSSSAQEFARLMHRHPNAPAERPRGQDEQRAHGWDRFKQSAFRFAGRILMADAFGRGAARRQEERQKRESIQDGQDGRGDAAEVQAFDEEGAQRAGGRGLLMRLGASLFRDRVASELSDGLAECVRHADMFGKSWKLDMLLSHPQLPQTRLHISSDAGGMRLHFTCGDPRARSVLENNRMLLLTRLGAISVGTVTIDIDDVDPVEASGGGNQSKEGEA